MWRNRIESGLRQRVTARDTSSGEPGSPEETVRPQSLDGVVRAGWFESARTAEPGTQEQPIRLNQQDAQAGAR